MIKYIMCLLLLLSVSCDTTRSIEDAILNPGQRPDESSPKPSPTPDLVPPAPPNYPLQPIDCPTLSPGPAVGLACLHCGAPSARANAISLAGIMRRACRENVATTMLLDGTFGDDLQLITEIIQEITRDGSRLHLYIYLSNGPWQRRQIPGGIGTQYNGGEWSWRIQTDAILRQEYTDNIRNLQPVFEALDDSGGILYLLPALEDNLSYEAARAVESLTVDTMATAFPSMSFAMGRNPSSADQSIVAGHFGDTHNINNMYPNGLSTNDGEDFEIEEIPPYIEYAGSINTTFVYWTRSFQGIAPGNQFPDPSIRDYRVPGEAEQEALRDLID